MPLIQSNTEAAFKSNIAKEIEHGKDPKQAAAIAYEIQRANDGEAIGLPESVTLASINEANKKYWAIAPLSERK